MKGYYIKNQFYLLYYKSIVAGIFWKKFKKVILIYLFLYFGSQHMWSFKYWYYIISRQTTLHLK